MCNVAISPYQTLASIKAGNETKTLCYHDTCFHDNSLPLQAIGMCPGSVECLLERARLWEEQGEGGKAARDYAVCCTFMHEWWNSGRPEWRCLDWWTVLISGHLTPH